MNRISILASSGLFAAGLLILPVAAFAQGGGATETKPVVAAPAGKAATMTDGKAAPMTDSKAAPMTDGKAATMTDSKAPAAAGTVAKDAKDAKDVKTPAKPGAS